MKRIPKSYLSFAIYFLAAFFTHAQAQELLYAATDPAAVNGWCVDNTEHNVAIKLSVPAGSSFDLALVRAPFEYALFDPPTSISVDVFRWTADASPPADPADLVARLPLNEALPTADPNETGMLRYAYTFSPLSPVRLDAGASYWVQFNVSSNSCAVSLLGSTALPTATQLIRGAEYQNWGGVWTNRTATYYTQVELLGAAASSVTTPVPATGPFALLLGGFGIVALVLSSTRRRRSQ